MKPRWAPASNHGQEFIDVISDPNYLFKSTLEPLDKQPLQADAFRRTTKAPILFKNEQASIIWAHDEAELHSITHDKSCFKSGIELSEGCRDKRDK